MTAKNTSRRLALLAAVLSLLMLLSFAVMPGFAAEENETSTETVTEESTEASTEAAGSDIETDTADEPATDDETEAGTAASTEAATGSETTTETSASAGEDDGMSDKEIKRLVINLGVGVVLLLGLGALAIVFRKKIPGWIKALKSECGKIVWCPKDKLIKNAKVVILIIVALAIAIGLMDYAFSSGLVLLRELFH